MCNDFSLSHADQQDILISNFSVHSLMVSGKQVSFAMNNPLFKNSNVSIHMFGGAIAPGH